VLVGEFDRDPARGTYPGETPPEHDPISHLELVARADAFIVAPASANTVAKLATGICDSMLTTSFLACTAPRIVAPAMNDRMWDAAATQANVATLRERGITVIEPDTGPLASRGEYGAGRLPEPERLMAELEAVLPGTSGPWDGLEVLVSAGGTREAIDPVRFIGNRSSGRMGVAVATAAAKRGAKVTLVAANVSLPTHPAIERIDVTSAAELADACRERFPAAHVLVMAAAVADFRPSEAAEGKMTREGSGGMTLELESTEDVLASLAAERRPGQTLIGFAAEHGGDFIERARGKLERKGIDAIVVNDVSDASIGFDSSENEVTVVEADGGHPIPRGSKDDVAEAILDRVTALRAHSPAA
jgi:phosphopantothenoylcysteine decarboxylase/phosphopantothenate--cysteine ligase